jgi:phosphoglycolate phosphatase-like HAD superfamily hydrolase
MHLTGLIFDMDGTLGDSLPFILIALRETFERFSGRSYSDAEIGAMFGPTEEGILAGRVAAEVYPQALGYFLGRYGDLHAPQPFPGIRDLLADLQACGLRIAVATGKGPGTAAISVRAYDLDAYIDRLETGSAHGGIKPELIRRVLDGWGLPASQAAYIGDSQSDMDDARAVGVLPIGAAWTRSATVTAADTPYLFTSVEALGAWLRDIQNSEVPSMG